MPVRIAFVFITLVLVHSVAAAADSVARAPLPFDLTARGGIIVPVIIDGNGPFAFVLDTGSNGSVISDELAVSLGSRVVAAATVSSVIGQERRAVVKIEHLALGA
jgi:hypothetical protein